MKDDLYLIAEQYEVVLNEAAEIQRRERNMLDNIQLGLDVVGIDLFNVLAGAAVWADGANAIISALRSGLALAHKENDIAKEHAINAAISAISIIPFQDWVKALKLRKLGRLNKNNQLTKLAVKGARAAKGLNKQAKIDRINDYRKELTHDVGDLD